MLQIVISVLFYILLVIPTGTYMYHITAHKKTFADPIMDKVDACIYKISGIDPSKEMNWKEYAISLLLTNLVMIALGYFILRLQGLLFFNPNGIGNMEASLSFNTVISCMTNTNLQHYSGES